MGPLRPRRECLDDIIKLVSPSNLTLLLKIKQKYGKHKTVQLLNPHLQQKECCAGA